MAKSNPLFPGAGAHGVAAAISAILAMSGATTMPTAASAAAATPTEPVPNEPGLQEIIVTATRRAERLQDVAESISAFDTGAISIRGLQQMEDYARLIPGLSVTPREPGATTVVFRGVASSGVQFGAVSSSAVYLDEQPITASGRSPDPRLIDIERVEALRGPQGTLYGASSQSGTLRVLTSKPNTRKFAAWAEAQVGSTEHGGVSHDVSAMVNVPLADGKFALRLVGFTAEDAGYIDNVLQDSAGGTYSNADVVAKDVNSKLTSGGRAALRWEATDKVNATLGAVFQTLKANGHGDTTPGAGDLNQVRFGKENLNDQWYQLALTVNAQLPFGDFVASASYFDRNFRYEADATDYEFAFNQLAIAYDSPIYDFGGDPRGYATDHEKTKITTFEARLSSPADSTSRWGWLAGAYYSGEKGHTEFDSYVRGYTNTPAFQYFSDLQVGLTGSPLAPTDTWFLGRYDPEINQVAAFGELSFDLTPHFKVTGGGRWFDYERKDAQQQEAPAGYTGDTQLNANQKSKEDGTVSKLNFTYKFDKDRLVYATYSEGFRVGGSNQLKPISLLPKTYKSDVLQNYELGAKSEWLNHRLRLNLSAYYMKWKDFAVQVEDPQPGVFQLGFVNLPNALITGLEAEFAVTASDQWQFDGSFTKNKARTDGASVLSVTDELGQTYTFSVSDGARLPLSPDWNANLGVEYRPHATLLNAKPYARFDYSYVGTSVNSLEGIESIVSGNPVTTLDPYQIGNLRFGLEGEHWSGSLFVDNVTDERANLFVSNRWKVQRQSVNRPRTIGIQIHYDF